MAAIKQKEIKHKAEELDALASLAIHVDDAPKLTTEQIDNMKQDLGITDLELKIDGGSSIAQPTKYTGFEFYVDENGIVQKRANSNCVCFKCGSMPGFAVCAYMKQYLEPMYLNAPVESEFILTEAFSQNPKAIQTIKSVGFVGGNGLYTLYVNVMAQETQNMTIELTILMPSVLQMTAYNVGKYAEHTFNDNEVAVNANTFYNNSIVKVTSDMVVKYVEPLGYEVVFDVPVGVDFSLGEGVSVPIIGEVDNSKRRMFSFLNGTLVIGNFEE